MIRKFLFWIGVFFGILLLWTYIGDLTWKIVLIGAIIVVLAQYPYNYIKTYLVYREDIEASHLIGRATCGIDHRGGITRRVIMHPKK